MASSGNMRQLPLNALRAFEAVARHGSFSRAADELFVTQSAVSHQVRHLEAWLGGPLLERDGNRTRLRPNGADLGRALTLALADIESACRQASRAGARPTLTVAVIPSVAICWLIPRLAEFRRHWPGIDIRIQYAIHGKDIDFGNMDVAVIYSEGPPDLPGMVATHFLPGQGVPVCASAIARANPAIGTPAGMVAAGLLHDTDHSGWQAWLSANGADHEAAANGPVFEDFNLLRAAALAGQGVAICPLAIIRDDLDAGRLVSLSQATIRNEFAYYVIRRQAPGTQTAAAQTAFCDWLLSTVRTPRSDTAGDR